MLEASDIERSSQVHLFLGAIIDVICGNENKTLAIKMNTQHSDLHSALKKKLTQPFWTDEKLSRFERNIRDFKAADTKLFEKYQAPGISTQKWHLHYHIVSSLKAVGCLGLPHASCFESTHCNFKQSYYSLILVRHQELKSPSTEKKRNAYANCTLFKV